MIWGVNFGSGTTANAAAMTKSIMTAFASDAVKRKNIQLDLIEIGVCSRRCSGKFSQGKNQSRMLIRRTFLAPLL